MVSTSAEQFLYLSTVGWKSGKNHRIEIWFVEHNGRYYVMSERMKGADWVRNLSHNSAVSFSVAGRSFEGHARIISDDVDPSLAAKVTRLMKDKYGWGDGLIVELTPNS